MWPFASSIDEIENNIIIDLKSFSNPGSKITSIIHKNTMDINWTKGREEFSAKFRLTAQSNLIVEFKDQKIQYKGFLASQYMADLDMLAQRILATLPQVENYVSANARVKNIDEAESQNIDYIIRNLCAEPFVVDSKILEATKLIFLRAPAGAGKTAAMRMLTRDQAQKYFNTDQDSHFLFFYVDAQGRALTRLHEALAFEIQSLGVTSIRYDSIPALVRNRLLVPIIDGFDELIGSGGFAEAFGSLSAFLSELERQGTILATGRSTFYDDQKFNIIAEKFSKGDSLNYNLETVELDLWGERELDEFVSKKFSKEADKAKVRKVLLKAFQSADQRNKELLSKAFFVSQFINFFNEDNFIPYQNEDFLSQLVFHLLNREVTKLKDRPGQIVLNSDGHKWFLRELSTEMWWQETRSVDLETIATIADLTADQFALSPEHRNIFAGRIPFHAFLCADRENPLKKRKFEHDVYYEYFLLDALLRLLDEKSGILNSFLSRSALGEALIEQLSTESLGTSPEVISKRISNLCSQIKLSPKGGLARQNAGVIASALLKNRKDLPDRLELSHLECNHVNFANLTLNDPVLFDCYFNEVNMIGAKLVNPIIRDCCFDKIIINTDSTIFSNAFLRPGKEIISMIVNGDSIYDPAELTRLLIQMGANVPDSEKTIPLTPDQKRIVKTIERLTNRLKRVLFFDPEDESDQQLHAIYKDQNWKKIWGALEKSKLIETKHLDRKGPRGFLYRLAIPSDEIMAGLSATDENFDPKIRMFWENILSS